MRRTILQHYYPKYCYQALASNNIFLALVIYDLSSLFSICGEVLQEAIWVNSIFKHIFYMRTTNTINLGNQFLINKKEMLGKGATGQVYAGKQLKDNIDVAVKVIDLKTVDNQVTQYLLAMEKIAVLSCDNPHVLKGIKVMQNNICCYIVTELCNGGSLKNLIKVTGPLGQEKSIRILLQILKGSCSLIGKGIVHRDLKPANILMHNGQAKIIDFGYCEIKGYPKPNLEYNVGSPSYMSPQAFLDNEYSEKSEIWAIGVTFYECLNGKTFDQGRNMAEVYKQMKSKGLNYRVEVSDRCKQIINWCLQLDPKKRPTTVQLLNFVVASQKNRPPSQFNSQPSQTVRLSFKPIENVDIRKKLYQKMEKMSPTSQYFNKDTYKKQQIMKPELQTAYNKVRTVLSSYQPKKLVPENRLGEKKSIFNPPRSKYDRNILPFDAKQPVLRHKSQLFQGQNQLGYATDRLKSKQNFFGMNPARAKAMQKITEGHKHRISAHNDYYMTVMQQQ